MDFANVMLKMAAQKKLEPAELNFLRDISRNLQTVNSRVAGWLDGGGNSIFTSPIIINPVWKSNPLNSTVFDVSGTIPTTTETQLTVNQAQLRTQSPAFTLGSTNVRIKVATKNNFLVAGNVNFGSGNTGYRYVLLVARDEGGTGHTYVLSKLPAVDYAGVDTVLNFSFLFDRVRYEVYNDYTLAEFEITVYHNYGSDLSVNGEIGLMEV